MGVAEEDIGDDVGGVAVDDLVEEVGGIGEVVVAGPAAGDVTHYPDSFIGVFCVLEFGDHPGEYAGVVWVGCVDEGEDVAQVPEVYLKLL